jgi:hypothetical protein
VGGAFHTTRLWPPSKTHSIHESESFRKVPSAGKPRIRAIAKLPPSRRPQNQSGLCRPGKPLALRLPRNHPGDGPRLTRPSDARTARPRAQTHANRMDLLRVDVAQGVRNRPVAQHLLAAVAAPLTGNPASHPVSGSPPSGMKAPTRLRGLSPTRANMSRRPGNRSQQGVVRKTGGRVLESARPAPQEPGTFQARPAALPVPRRALRGRKY